MDEVIGSVIAKSSTTVNVGNKNAFIFKGWTYLKKHVRKATAKEIKKIEYKRLEENVGEYEVNYASKKYINVGCQTVTKEQFVLIGKRAGWIKAGKITK